MRNLRASSAVLGVTALLFAPAPAKAGWDNVFQVTCHCGSRGSANYAPPSYSSSYAAPSCCPQTCCTPCCPQVAYVQRSYYQPTTCYRPVVNCEPVVSYRTSYYWEPMTSYCYSCYTDPCTGCSTQVATPTTSYRLRSQCNAVTSYVQRVSYQPVTTYRQSFYYEPVTVMPPTVYAPAAAPVITAPPAATSPPININPPITTESTPGATPQSPPPPLNAPDNRSMPGSTGNLLGGSLYPPTQPPAPATAKIQPNQIAAAGSLAGTVVRRDFQPLPGAKLHFVNAQNINVRQEAIADVSGRFSVALPPGAWQLYMDDASGRPTLHSQLDVKQQDSRLVTVVSR